MSTLLLKKGYAKSASTGTFVSTNSAGFDTPISVGITTRGGKVAVLLTSDKSGLPSFIAATNSFNTYTLRVLRDGVDIFQINLGGSSSPPMNYSPTVVQTIDDTVTAGDHTYQLQIRVVAAPGANFTTITRAMLVLQEL